MPIRLAVPNEIVPGERRIALEPGVAKRLLDMGVKDYLLTSTVNAVLAQRLVRSPCHHCREPYTPTDEVVMHWGLQRFTGDKPVTLYRATGCEHCGHSGYKGRNAILELLVMTDPIRQLVIKHSDSGDIARAAAENGMHLMIDDGLRKALAGKTTLEEVCRVTQEHPNLGQTPREPAVHTATRTTGRGRKKTGSPRDWRLTTLLHWIKRRPSALAGFVQRK